jgi:hypothetical protein
MKNRKPVSSPLPPPQQMRALLDAVAAIHAAGPGRRLRVVLEQLVALFDPLAASADCGPHTCVIARPGSTLAPGPGPRKLLGLTRGLSRVVVFTAAELTQRGRPHRLPRGVREAFYSLAPPGPDDAGSVLGLYFAGDLSPGTRIAVAADLRLLHSAAYELLDGSEG